MKRILLSLATVGAVAGVAIASSGAFFSDAETSTGNTFQAGTIDLQLDSECHQWIGGVYSLCNGGNWDLNQFTGQTFFNFDDIKPGDYGENTISLHVDNNDAWVCSQIDAKDEENTLVDPELDLADTATTGELGKYLHMVWWTDDGDNVYENDETALFGGPVTFDQLLGWNTTYDTNIDEGAVVDLTLADSNLNVFAGSGAIPGASTQHIAVGWCFGDITLTPQTPGNLDPATNPGFTCTANQTAGYENISQTDKISGSLAFSAIQSRNNLEYVCPEHEASPIPSPTP